VARIFRGLHLPDFGKCGVFGKSPVLKVRVPVLDANLGKGKSALNRRTFHDL